MAKKIVVISDPETGKSNSVEVSEDRSKPLIGRRIGEIVDGSILGISGFKVTIMGGCDSSGFPMRPDVHGGIRSKILLRGGVGYRVKRKGIRRRKTVHGNTITEDISQINVKIVQKPKSSKVA